MTGRLFCVSIVFTTALACDDSVNPPDMPHQDTYGGPVAPTDPVHLAGTESGESDSESESGESQSSFCLPLEILGCYTATSKAVAECPPGDCQCPMRTMYYEQVDRVADCVNAACPAHYPDRDRYASCYRDWYTDNKSCFDALDCAEWSDSCGGGQVGLYRYLQSCMSS